MRHLGSVVEQWSITVMARVQTSSKSAKYISIENVAPDTAIRTIGVRLMTTVLQTDDV